MSSSRGTRRTGSATCRSTVFRRSGMPRPRVPSSCTAIFGRWASSPRATSASTPCTNSPGRACSATRATSRPTARSASAPVSPATGRCSSTPRRCSTTSTRSRRSGSTTSPPTSGPTAGCRPSSPIPPATDRPGSCSRTCRRVPPGGGMPRCSCRGSSGATTATSMPCASGCRRCGSGSSTPPARRPGRGIRIALRRGPTLRPHEEFLWDTRVPLRRVARARRSAAAGSDRRPQHRRDGVPAPLGAAARRERGARRRWRARAVGAAVSPTVRARRLADGVRHRARPPLDRVAGELRAWARVRAVRRRPTVRSRPPGSPS